MTQHADLIHNHGSGDPRAQAAAYLAERDLLNDPLADLWLDSIERHLEPLPANRLWRIRTGRNATRPVGDVVRHVTAQLQPPAGTSPQPQCPTWCFVQHGLEDTA